MTHDDQTPAPFDSDSFAPAEVDRLRHATIVDNTGEKIGNVEQIYLHEVTGRPSWASVRVGLFRTRSTLVPLDGVDLTGDEIRVPFSRVVVKDAPRVDVDDHISTGEEGELHNYYRSHGWAGADRPAGRADDQSSHDLDHDREVRPSDPADQADQADQAGYATAPVDEFGDDQAPAEFVTSGDTEASADAAQDAAAPVEHMDTLQERAEVETNSDGPAFAGGAAGAVPDAPGDHYASPAADHAEATPRSIGIDDTDPDAPLPGVHQETPEVEETVSEDLSPGHPEPYVPPAAVAPGAQAGQFPDEARADGSGGRRISDYDEVRDGGYGIGSAAPIEDGAQPLGHPVRAWEDTKTFRGGPEGDWEREPDVWFMDEQAAGNAGFRPSEY